MKLDGQGGDGRQDGIGGRRRRSSAARRRTGIHSAQRRTGAAKRSYTRSREPSAKRNYLTRRGAEALARHIENYWRSLGFNVRTWLVPVKENEKAVDPGDVMAWRRRGNMWCVRSSLANGLPPGRVNPFHGGNSLANRRFQGPGVKFIDAPLEGSLPGNADNQNGDHIGDHIDDHIDDHSGDHIGDLRRVEK